MNRGMFGASSGHSDTPRLLFDGGYSIFGVNSNRSTASSYTSTCAPVQVECPVKCTAIIWDFKTAGLKMSLRLNASGASGDYLEILSDFICSADPTPIYLPRPLIMFPGATYYFEMRSSPASSWNDNNSAGADNGIVRITCSYYDGSLQTAYWPAIKLMYQIGKWW